MLRKATQADAAQLVRLRCAASHETAAQAGAWLQDVIGWENLLLVQEAPPRIDAAVALLPVECGRRRGLWLGGLLADAGAQGAEQLPRLLAAILRGYTVNGYDFAVTVPPGAAMREALVSLGFQDAFAMRLLQRSITRNLWAQAEFDTMTVRRYQESRLRYQPGGILLPERAMTGTLRQLYARGITIVSNQRGYGLFYTVGDTLQFAELQADNDHSADILLQAARNQTGLEKARLLLGEAQSLYLGQGKRCLYGMICFLKTPFPVTDVYFRTFL